MTYNNLIFRHLGIIILLILSVSCGSKREASAEQISQLDQMVEDREFEIDAQWARPLVTNSLNQLANAGLLKPGDNASQISVQGTNSFLRFEGYTVSAYLPYYGERQFGGAYDNDGAIEFEGVPRDLEINKNEDKNYYSIEFNIQKDAESYKVNLVLYPNFKGLINVNSAQRFPIRYEGNIKGLDKKKE